MEKSVINKINKFNRELEEAITIIGENSFYDIDTTIIGDQSTIGQIKYDDSVVTWEDDEYRIYDEDCYFGKEQLFEDIRYMRRRIKKTLKVWYSENPDIELENDNEDEE